MYKEKRKERTNEMVPQNVKKVGRGNARGFVGAQQTKNAFIISKEQVIRIWIIITWRKQASI